MAALAQQVIQTLSSTNLLIRPCWRMAELCVALSVITGVCKHSGEGSDCFYCTCNHSSPVERDFFFFISVTKEISYYREFASWSKSPDLKFYFSQNKFGIQMG